jgi:hypothetical protein
MAVLLGLAVLSLVYLLYQYKRTWHELLLLSDDGGRTWTRGTQFTCFTSTKVQILTPEELGGEAAQGTREMRVAITSAQVVLRLYSGSTEAQLRLSVLRLY